MVREPSTLISLRLPASMLDRVDAVAAEQGVDRSTAIRSVLHAALPVVAETATAEPPPPVGCRHPMNRRVGGKCLDCGLPAPSFGVPKQRR